MNVQLAMQHMTKAQCVVQAYEEFLYGKLQEGGFGAEFAVDAMQAKYLVKQQESSETMVFAMENRLGSPDAHPNVGRDSEPTPEEYAAAQAETQEREKRDRDKNPHENPGTIDLGFGIGTLVDDKGNDKDAITFFKNRKVGGTLGGMFGLDDSGQELSARAKAEKFMADCIPCDGRDFPDMDFFRDSFLRTLQQDLKQRFAWMDQFEGFLNNIDPFEGLCNLLNLLNFLCLPDIMLMYMVLMNTLRAEIAALKNISLGDAVFDIASAILRPYIAGLSQLLDLWISALIAPIECVIDAILAQASKLDFSDDKETTRSWRQQASKTKRDVVGWTKATLDGSGPRRTTTEFYEVRGDTLDLDHRGTLKRDVKSDPSRTVGEFSPRGAGPGAVNAANTMLERLTDSLIKGVAGLRDGLLVVEEELKALMGAESDRMDKALTLSQNLKLIARLVNIFRRFWEIGEKFSNGEQVNICAGPLEEEAVREIVETIFETKVHDGLESGPREGGGARIIEDEDGAFEGIDYSIPGSYKDGRPETKFISMAGCMGRSPSTDALKVQRWILEMAKEEA